MKTSNRLPKQEMYEILSTLTSLQEEMLAELSEDDKSTVMQWITSICLFNPSVMLRPDSLIEISDSIFGSSVIADYVLDLTFRFYTLAGNTNTFAQDLVTNLTLGLSLDGPDINYSLIPPELKQSMPTSLYPNGQQLSLWNRLLARIGLYTPITVEQILLSNKHLVVVFLLHITNTTRRTIDTESLTQNNTNL